MKREDKVCQECRAILRWYPEAGYFHVRSSGQYYVTGHKPTPSDGSPSNLREEQRPTGGAA